MKTHQKRMLNEYLDHGEISDNNDEDEFFSY
jgi:hypothetical protein